MPLGWGYTNHTIAISTLFGFAQVALILFLIARIFRKKSWRGPALPWLILAAHVLLTAALTAAGRAGFGVQYAATLRYTSYSLFITVAIVYLVPFAFDAPRHLAWKLLAIAAAFLTLLTIQPASAEASRIRAKYLAGRATLHYILVLNTKPQPGDLLSPGDTALPTAAIHNSTTSAISILRSPNPPPSNPRKHARSAISIKLHSITPPSLLPASRSSPIARLTPSSSPRDTDRESRALGHRRHPSR